MILWQEVFHQFIVSTRYKVENAMIAAILPTVATSFST